MAHWAELDKNNIVLRVTVGNNDEPDEGYQWLIDNLGGKWVQTSYNSIGGVHYSDKLEQFTKEINGELKTFSKKVPSGKPHFRYNFAGIGYVYDEKRDAFIPPKPENGNWILNENTCLWEEITSE